MSTGKHDALIEHARKLKEAIRPSSAGGVGPAALAGLPGTQGPPGMFRPVMMSAEKYGRTYDILTLEVSPCLSEEPWLKRAVEAFKRELPPMDAVVQRFHEKSEPEVVDREQGIIRTSKPIPWPW